MPVAAEAELPHAGAEGLDKLVLSACQTKVRMITNTFATNLQALTSLQQILLHIAQSIPTRQAKVCLASRLVATFVAVHCLWFCKSHNIPYPMPSVDILTKCRRHAKSCHKLNYCRHCCNFYDVRSKYCPGCQRFCMSPSCFQVSQAVGFGNALSQRHSRGPHCPEVWGSASGVPDEHVLDYLRRLGTSMRRINVLVTC